MILSSKVYQHTWKFGHQEAKAEVEKLVKCQLELHSEFQARLGNSENPFLRKQNTKGKHL